MPAHDAIEPRDGFAPEQIRTLRGTLSRALFAQRLGVTPNTVYRWELPLDAAEARRPRGEHLDKLRRLARGEHAVVAPPAGDASSAPPARSRANEDDVVLALLAVERIFRGEVKRGQAE